MGLNAAALHQECDHFGQTVNLAARIAEYAVQARCLVSQAVAYASREDGVTFSDIGPVDLNAPNSSTS